MRYCKIMDTAKHPYLRYLPAKAAIRLKAASTRVCPASVCGPRQIFCCQSPAFQAIAFSRSCRLRHAVYPSQPFYPCCFFSLTSFYLRININTVAPAVFFRLGHVPVQVRTWNNQALPAVKKAPPLLPVKREPARHQAMPRQSPRRRPRPP